MSYEFNKPVKQLLSARVKGQMTSGVVSVVVFLVGAIHPSTTFSWQVGGLWVLKTDEREATSESKRTVSLDQGRTSNRCKYPYSISEVPRRNPVSTGLEKRRQGADLPDQLVGLLCVVDGL